MLDTSYKSELQIRINCEATINSIVEQPNKLASILHVHNHLWILKTLNQPKYRLG